MRIQSLCRVNRMRVRVEIHGELQQSRDAGKNHNPHAAANGHTSLPVSQMAIGGRMGGVFPGRITATPCISTLRLGSNGAEADAVENHVGILFCTVFY